MFFYFFEDLKDSGYTRIQVFYEKVEGQLFLAVGLPAVRRCSRAFSARKRTLYLFTLLVLRFEYTSKRLNCIDLNIKSSHSVWIMGNKHKLTGKERRAAVREEKKRALASRALVAKAKEKRDPLDELSIPLKMSLVGFDAVVTSSHWCTLDKETQEWILKLEEINVREMYEKSDWGWNGKVKQEEMTDEDARYLIARSAEGKPLGFSHFRFDMDFEDEVLYCYELQIEEHARRKGLGGFMLRVLEELTTHYNMKKTMLTVFKHNHPGRTFFKKNGYKLDETSPEDDDEEEEACYEILSKYNLKFDPPIV